jgi:hypothetical protein
MDADVELTKLALEAGLHQLYPHAYTSLHLIERPVMEQRPSLTSAGEFASVRVSQAAINITSIVVGQ